MQTYYNVSPTQRAEAPRQPSRRAQQQQRIRANQSPGTQSRRRQSDSFATQQDRVSQTPGTSRRRLDAINIQTQHARAEESAHARRLRLRNERILIESTRALRAAELAKEQATKVEYLKGSYF